jgi:PAS domain S-box-containing protein
MIGPVVFLSIILLIISILLYFKLKKIKSKIGLLQLTFQEEKTQLRQNSEQEKKTLLEKIELLELQARVTRQSENAIMLMNAKGDIIWTNDSFTRMYEYTYEEFTQKLGSNIRQTSFSGEINERLRRCFSTKQSVSYDAPNITKTGKEIWTRTALIPLLDEENEVCGLVTIDSDINNRVKTGNKLVEYIQDFNRKTEGISEQLNALVELTDALFERIDISQRRIERTDEIIDFIKGISDQTKILGINASIEAHAAGDHGRGFRVIANEIVNVSNVTLNALREIYELINKIQRSTDKLSSQREQSEKAISSHRNLIQELKREINEVECMILQMN